jgi:putative hemolysin
VKPEEIKGVLDPASYQEIISVVVLVLLYALFSAAEVALISVRKARVKQLVEEGDQTAVLIDRLSENSGHLLATAEFGRTIAGAVAVVTAAVVFTPKLSHWIASADIAWLTPASTVLAVAIVILAMTVGIVIFGQLLPKRLARQYAEGLAFTLAAPFHFFAAVSWPVVSAMMTFSNGLATLLGGEELTAPSYFLEEEIRTMVDAGEEEGVIEEEEKEMIYSIFEFGDTLTREIMVPRIDVVALDVNTPLLEALDVILAAGHSRVPLYADTIDDVEGVLYAKDLLACLRDGQNTVALSGILRPAYFVPETKKVDDLLTELQQRKVHMAIVVDEYGGTAGIVTIEDILEEIVGEIQDEYDTEESFYEVVSPDEIVFDARTNLDDVDKLLGVELPHEGGDTLGGLIYAELGRVPAALDVVEIDGVKLTVLSVAARRIKKVKATRLPKPAEVVALPEESPETESS